MNNGVLPDLTPFFTRYETLAHQADTLFARIRGQHPDLVTCRERCSDCCHALFDLTLIETLYLNKKFPESVPNSAERGAVLDRAAAADRQIARIKRKIFKDSKAGRDSNEILAQVAGLAVRCPLLGDDERCLMYEARPITCRLYGVPTAIGGASRTCAKTGFRPGKPYPTVALDKMQALLDVLSQELAAALGSAYTQLASMYVPVSTALITVYDAAYLGIGGIAPED